MWCAQNLVQRGVDAVGSGVEGIGRTSDRLWRGRDAPRRRYRRNPPAAGASRRADGVVPGLGWCWVPTSASRPRLTVWWAGSCTFRCTAEPSRGRSWTTTSPRSQSIFFVVGLTANSTSTSSPPPALPPQKEDPRHRRWIEVEGREVVPDCRPGRRSHDSAPALSSPTPATHAGRSRGRHILLT
jgi:hypothetical protein